MHTLLFKIKAANKNNNKYLDMIVINKTARFIKNYGGKRFFSI